jgi:hypothetical protein
MEDFSVVVPWQTLAYLVAFPKVFRKNTRTGRNCSEPHMSVRTNDLDQYYKQMFSRSVRQDVYFFSGLGFLETKTDQWRCLYYAAPPEKLKSLPPEFFNLEAMYHKAFSDDHLLRSLSSVAVGKLDAADLTKYLELRKASEQPKQDTHPSL